MEKQPCDVCSQHHTIHEVIAEIRRDIEELKKKHFVKVVNGKTDIREVGDLIAEMYLDMKEIKQNRPSSLWKKAGEWLAPLLQVVTLLSALYVMFK